MLLTIITFLVLLSVLVIVHEVGHFLAAKKAGIKVEEFGVGYPPRLLAKKIGETVYSLNWVPFGGFVKLYGEELAEGVKKDAGKSFWSKSKKARSGVILSGVVANFLLGIFCFSIVYSFTGIPIRTGSVKIIEVANDSPAQKVGLKAEDRILALGDKNLTGIDDFINRIQEGKGQEIKLVVAREEENPCREKDFDEGMGSSCQGDNLVLFITPRAQTPAGEGPLGVIVSDMEIKKFPFWQMPFRGAIEGTKEALNWGWLIFISLKKMVGDLLFSGIVPKDVAGPIGIFQATGVVAKTGILNLIQFGGILSVNLAVLNIMPFPALDGGRIIFIVYELITRKKPKASIEHWVNAVGMSLLVLLLVAITINDIVRIVVSTALINKIKALFPF